MREDCISGHRGERDSVQDTIGAVYHRKALAKSTTHRRGTQSPEVVGSITGETADLPSGWDPNDPGAGFVRGIDVGQSQPVRQVRHYTYYLNRY
jgi:hypothetical protein